MTLFREFTDPRMAAVYDALGPGRADTDFYLELAAELAPARSSTSDAARDCWPANSPSAVTP